MMHAVTQLNAWSYELKITQVEGYSKPWVLISASGQNLNTISDLRLHLHGWTQEPKTGKAYYPLFDFDWKNPQIQPTSADLKKFVDAYGIGQDVDQNPNHAVLIPISRGRCDQYRELLDDFERIYLQTLKNFGIFSNQIKLTRVSAHSGGGEYLSRLIVDSRFRSFSDVNTVVFYDAIYSDMTRDRLISWVNLPSSEYHKKLVLPVIRGQGPSHRAHAILDTWPDSEKTEIHTMGSLKILIRSKTLPGENHVLVISEDQGSTLLNHWTLVRELWNFPSEIDGR